MGELFRFPVLRSNLSHREAGSRNQMQGVAQREPPQMGAIEDPSVRPLPGASWEYRSGDTPVPDVWQGH